MGAVLLAIGLAAAQTDVPAQVRGILETKCAQCHGPAVAHPKGHFGFITDLARLAADSRYIVPGDPENSFLWRQIDEGEMPPD